MKSREPHYQLFSIISELAVISSQPICLFVMTNSLCIILPLSLNMCIVVVVSVIIMKRGIHVVHILHLVQRRCYIILQEIFYFQ